MYINFDINKEFGFKAHVYYIKIDLLKTSISNQSEIISLLLKTFVIIITIIIIKTNSFANAFK